jgi:hypothetical protein
MRRACVIFAALALAACKVDLEGARCNVPGSPAECPDGQACGNDLRCSTRAAGCLARCDLQATTCVGITEVKTCVGDVDPVCGSWQTQACGTNLVCVERGQAHACECGANGTTVFAAGTGGSPVGGPWYPTGLEIPPQCRFRQLGDALEAAVAHGGPTTVKAYGDPGAAVTFTGETFPLVVPNDVTISGADSPAGETILQGDAATSATMVTLQGTLERVHLQNVSMTGNGVGVTCGTGTPTLRDVIVSAGTQRLARAVTVAGPCGASLERVDASGATSAALDVAADAGALVTVTGGRFHASGTGLQVTGGKLDFRVDSTTGGTQVTDNIATVPGAQPDTVGTGILLIGNSTVIDATMTGVVVARNAGTGMYVNSISSSSSLTMTSCDVFSNGTGAPQAYGPAPQRSAGGILLTQSSLTTFAFQSNRIYANDGGKGADELAFYSSGAWNFNPPVCGPATNAFGCMGVGKAVSITTGTVDARNSLWSEIPPPLNGAVTWSPECSGTAPACPP